MAKWKEVPITGLLALEIVDPRVRMKEIRAEVSSFLNKVNPYRLNNLGELPQNLNDARRVIVSVQDLLEKSSTKHKKATNIVCGLQNHVAYLEDVVALQVRMAEARELTIEHLDSQVRAIEKQMSQLYDNSCDSRYERDALLTTMKLLNTPVVSGSTLMSAEKKRDI